MKKIIYIHPEVKLVAVCEPIEGGRLASAIHTTDGVVVAEFDPPVAASIAAGGWPKAGHVAKWAETEDEFVLRIQRLNTPAGSVVVDDVPANYMFHRAWKIDGGKVVVDLEPARAIAHELRRARRADAFAPHDDAIAKRIPGMETAAEAERVKVRERFAVMQVAIDAAKSVDDLTAVLAG